MGDKSIPHIDDIEGSGQRKQRNSIRSSAAVRVVRPKTPRKTGSKANCSHDPPEGTAAVSSGQDMNCFDRNNCKLTVESDGKMVDGKMMVGNRRDSAIENSSEKEGLVDWVPPVHSIILAIEQETAANDVNRSGTLDFNRSDRFARCSHDQLEGSAAISSSQDRNCFDRTNCKLTVETDGKMVAGNRRDSVIENSSEKEGLVDWVPPVHSIIFALEQETAAYDANRSATPDFNKSDRFARCRFNFDVKKDNFLPNSDVKKEGKSQPLSATKKTPPQVPVKTFKYDQSRILQTQLGCSPLQVTPVPLIKGQRRQLRDHKYVSNDANISLSEVEKLRIYHDKYSTIRIDENGLERLPSICSSEAYLEMPDGLDLDILKNFGHRLCFGSGSIALDSPAWTTSSSGGSLVKEQEQDGFDTEELEIKLKSITSFTTEDVEFCQKSKCQPSPSYQSLHSCEEVQKIKRVKDPAKEASSCMKERARNRRSRSVGAPGFHLKDFVQRKERPKVPAKPKNRAKRQIVGEQSSSVLSSDRSFSVPVSEQIHGIPTERTGDGICGTFEQVLVLQVHEDKSFSREGFSSDDKPVISFEQTGVRKNNQTVVSEVHTEPDLHLKLDPLGKTDDSRVRNPAAMHLTKNCSDSGGQNSPKLHITEFFVDFGVQHAPKSNFIYVTSDLRLPNGPELQFTPVSGDLKVENASKLPLNVIASASGVPVDAKLNFVEVSGDLNAQNILESPIREVASDSKLQSASKACRRESLYDEDGSSARSFGLTSRSESLASNFVDLDQEMSLESSESLASSSVVKLDELDSSSESHVFHCSLSGSCSNVEQEKLLDDPQQKNMLSCDKTSTSHSTRTGSPDPEICNTTTFPEFDLTFSTMDSIAGAPDEGSRSSLYAEIVQTLLKSNPTQHSDMTTSESPYSQGKTALISSDVSNPKCQNSYDALIDARKLSAAIDGMRLEMEMEGTCTVEPKKHGNKQPNFVSPADSGPKKGSTMILRNMSGRLPEDRKKSMNRKASRAQSFKAWQRITSRPTRKSSSKQFRDSNLDDTNPEDLSFSDNDDFDFEMDSFSDDSDPEFDISSPSRKNEKAERTKQNARTAFHIASELLTTESNYVRKLHLVDQIFHLEVVLRNREHHMFSGDVIPQMFSNIKSIYQFHHDFVLPQLEKRMMEWDTNPRIGDVMKKFAPFLKLYTEYVRNFDNAITTINLWMERSPKFQKLIEGIQKLPECGHLNLQHHMLEPVQRVPRYQLLLKDYLRHLSEDSDDREDTIEALELVTQAARHSNEVMRKIEKFRKLVDINESLGGTIDLVSSSREFIKEGKLTRISARDGSHMDRYLFLFSDLFLVCQTLPLNIGQKQQYRMKSRMDFDGMEIVTDGHNLETANTFYVKGKQKSIELHASSTDEKNDWMTAFQNVIAEIRTNNQRDELTDEQLGKRAPTWIKDQETSMCMSCCSPFNAFRRRHHCRACGHVVCGKCSSRRAPLAYIENREKRVCDACFQTLYGVPHRKISTESVDTVSSCDEPVRKKGILQVKASDPAVIQGYLNMCCKRKTWSRRFFAVHADFVLYCFKAHQDVVALTSLPLPGYHVECDTTDDRMFRVYHTGQKKIFYFQAEDENTRKRWTEALQLLVQLQLPSESLNEPRSPV